MSIKNIITAAAGGKTDKHWQVAGAKYVTAAAVTLDDTDPRAAAFNNDGSKMYMVGRTNKKVYQYSLSTLWDVSTAVYTSAFSVSGYDITPSGVKFNADGTKMYIAGDTSDYVYEFKLNTAWDVTSAVYSVDNFSVTAQDPASTGVTFNNDGTKMYTIGITNDSVYQYSLGVAYDVTTATFVKSFSITTQDTSPQGLSFSNDGTSMYIIGDTTDAVYQYALKTAWDIGTAVYGSTFSVTANDTAPQAMAFNADGTSMYVVGTLNKTVYQYNLSSPWNTLTATLSKSFSVAVQSTSPRGLTFGSNGTKMYVADYLSNTVYQYNLTTAWDVSTAVYYNLFLVSGQETSIGGVILDSTGTKMYVIGTGNKSVLQYNLTTAWDITTAKYYLPYTSIVSQDSLLYGTAFSADGTKMYVIGTTNKKVYQYNLTTAWYLPSAVYYTSFLLSGQDTAPFGIAIDPTGTKMYVAGTTNKKIYQYNLTTAGDVSTAVYNNSFTVTQDTMPQGVQLKSDGTKMYVTGATNKTVYEFELTTAWDVTTAKYAVTSLSVTAGNLRGATFSTDGTQMYVVDSSTSTVYQYTLSVAWAIYSATYVKSVVVLGTPQSITFGNNGLIMYVQDSVLKVTYQYKLSTAWDVTTSISPAQPIANSGTAAYFYGITFSDDGMKMFVVDRASSPVVVDIKCYALKSKFDTSVNSITLLNSFSVLAQDSNAVAVTFNTTGTKMYVVGQTNNKVYQYNLSTAWDVTTSVFYTSWYVGVEVVSPTGVTFSTDGTKMYVAGTLSVTSNRIQSYNLTTAWDISTIIAPEFFLVSAQDTSPQGVTFSTDGMVMYVLGKTGNKIMQYNLSSPWKVLTAVYFNAFAVAQDTSAHGVIFNSTGTKMYIVGDTNNKIYQYNLSTAWNITTAVYYNGFVVTTQDATPYALSMSVDGTKLYVYGNTSKKIFQYTLSTAFDVTTAVYSTKSLLVSGQDTSPQEITFDPTGTKMYMTGTNAKKVYQYTLSTAWDISTAVYVNALLANTQETTPYGLSLDPTGTYLFLVGTAKQTVYKYTLTTPWDVTTAVYTNISADFISTTTYQTGATSLASGGLAFNADGTLMYATSAQSTSSSFVVQFGLSTPWDIKTATVQKAINTTVLSGLTSGTLGKPFGFHIDASGKYIHMTVVSVANKPIISLYLGTAWDIGGTSNDMGTNNWYAKDTAMRGVAFNSTGTKMYYAGQTNDSVYQYTLSTAWDVTTAVYVSQISIAAQETSVWDVTFDQTGTKMYLTGTVGNSIYQYNLSTAWDIATAVYYNKFIVPNTVDSAIYGLSFDSTGTKAYVAGDTNNIVVQLGLATAWDISTAYYSNPYFAIASAQDILLQTSSFSADGTKMYVVGTTNKKVYQYNLSTAWKVGTAVYYNAFLLSGQDSALPRAVNFNSDGTRMYMTGDSSNSVYQYTVNTPWDVTTAVYVLPNIIVTAQSNLPQGVTFSTDGTKMYIVESSNDSVLQYTLSSPWELNSTAVYVKSFSVTALDTDPSDVTFNSTGTVMYVLGQQTDTVYQFDVSTPWDIATAVAKTPVYSVATQDTSPRGLTFSTDGTKMYAIGALNGKVYQYNLSTAWDVRSSVYSNSFTVSTQDSTPTEVTFSTDGTKMYITGVTNVKVYQYNLSTAWNITTAVYFNALAVTTRDNDPQGLTFSADGTTMIVLGSQNDRVYHYALSTAWNITTATYVADPKFYVGSQDTFQVGFTFSTDGTKMYTNGGNNDKIYQYNLSTPWVVASATYTSFISIGASDLVTYGVAFSADGKKMFFTGDTGNSVYQYNLLTAWDVTTAKAVRSFSVATQDTSPTNVTFDADGSNMYVTGTLNDKVYQYKLI